MISKCYLLKYFIFNNNLLEGKIPNISEDWLIIAYKLLNDNSDINKELYNIFSNKDSFSKSFEKIKKNFNKIIMKIIKIK